MKEALVYNMLPLVMLGLILFLSTRPDGSRRFKPAAAITAGGGPDTT